MQERSLTGLQQILRRVSPQTAEAPNRLAALHQYRDRANVYDFELLFAEPIRRRAIGKLGLRRAQTVIDAGCGTGLSFPLLQKRIGQLGRIIGIEQSPDMIIKAQRRIETNRWRNVTLVRSPVEEAAAAVEADAALFHFTHDILRTPEAVANVIRRLRPGATVVATGLKWAPFWALAVNAFVWAAASRSVSSFEGLEKPWSYLADLVEELKVESILGGGVFVAKGTVPQTKPLELAGNY
jgi:ubiquinone/menaquinone biosynthesis C-methylase UbiE